MAGAELPDHTMDGYDLMPFLTGEIEASPRESYPYFLRGELQAYREGRWKLRLAGEEPQLFDLQNDPGERWNRVEDEPEVVERLWAEMEQLAEEVGADISGE